MSIVKVYETPIREYDMKAAGISVAAEKGLISEEVYEDLIEGTTTDKMMRQVLIGKLMEEDNSMGKDELKKAIHEGITEYVNKFIEINNIKESNIIEIAKDAVFIKGTQPRKKRLGDYVRFVEKGVYYLTIEFPIKEGSKRNIKLYKTIEDLKCRGAKINKEHEAYEYLYDLFIQKMAHNPVAWNKTFMKLKRNLKGNEKQIIENVDNEYLCDILVSYLS